MALLLVLPAILAAGCVTRRVGAPPLAAAGAAPGADPADAMADMDLRILCDRARVVIPERLRKAVIPVNGCEAPPHLFLVRDLQIETREEHAQLEVAGDDFTVVAEGAVKITLRENGKTTEEGPYRTVVVKNGTILRR